MVFWGFFCFFWVLISLSLFLSLSLSFSLENGSLRRRKENVKWREEWGIYRGDLVRKVMGVSWVVCLVGLLACLHVFGCKICFDPFIANFVYTAFFYLPQQILISCYEFLIWVYCSHYFFFYSLITFYSL